MVLITSGPMANKLAVIVDVVNHHEALVDGPESGVPRQAISFKRIALTDFVISIPPGVRTTPVSKAWKKADIDTKWAQTAWAKKLATRAKRASLSDFERFVVRVNRQKRARAVNGEFNKLKKASK